MNFENEFLHIINTGGNSIKKEEIEFPLNFKNVAYTYLFNNYLYVIPNNNNSNLESILGLREYIEKNSKYSRIYIFIPSFFREWEHFLNKIKVNYLSSKGKEFYYYNKQQNCSTTELFTNVRYTKSTQIVFKYFILNNKITATVREISDATNLSISTISVALFTLNKIGILDTIGFSTSTSYILKNKSEAFKRLEKYFINPIKSSVFILINEKEQKFLFKKLLLSSEYAFEEYTDLSANTSTLQMAVSPSDYKIIMENLHSNDDAHILLELQKFIYDPQLFSSSGIIDKFDSYLLLLFKRNRSIRENEAISQLKDELLHYDKKQDI